MSKKQRWMDSLPDIGDRCSQNFKSTEPLEYLLLALQEPDGSVSQMEYAQHAAARVVAWRKSFDVESERVEYPAHVVSDKLWYAVYNLAAGEGMPIYHQAQSLREAEAALRELWYNHHNV